jgi:hypothetical protein
VALETNLHAFWGAKQAAKGAAAAAPSTSATGKRLRLIAGDLTVNRNDVAENYSDLTEFGDAQDAVDTVTGSGEPVFHSTPDELAWLVWLLNANETVTNIVGPPATKEHVSIPGSSRFWATFWKRVGSTVIERQKFVDTVVSQLQITAGSGQRIMRATSTLMPLQPGIKFDGTGEPTLAMPTVDAFVWQEATGAVVLNGTPFRGATQYTLTVNRALELLYGDDVHPYDVQPGNSVVGVSVSMVLDQPAFDLANLILYGTAAPAVDVAPASFIGNDGAFTVQHDQKDGLGAATGRRAKFEVPGVKWDPPDAVAVPNPDGGGGTLELTGQGRKVVGQPMWRSTIRTDSAAFTA